MCRTISSRVAILIALTFGASGLAQAASSLGAYNVNPNTVTVAGISSGGYMAVQLQVAYSAHSALHGCLSNQQTIGTQFVKGSGINEWADNNNILVLYPQTIASVIPVNSEGCWDWWGYTNSNYAVKSAPQMTAIMNMVNKITGGF